MLKIFYLIDYFFEDEVFWEIKQITDAYYEKGKRFYKVKWSDVGVNHYEQ